MTTGYANPYVVADAEPSVRAQFIRQTYFHLGGAITAFIVIEALLLQIAQPSQPWSLKMTMRHGIGCLYWRAFMVGFHHRTTSGRCSDVLQSHAVCMVLGLLHHCLFAILSLPLIYFAQNYTADSQLVTKAALITGLMVAGITATAFITKKDFSFLGGILTVCGLVALGIIVTSIIFDGFELGLIFAGAMALFASVAILHTTSKIIHHYRTDQHIAASLELFGSIILLFWYILQILIALGRD